MLTLQACGTPKTQMTQAVSNPEPAMSSHLQVVPYSGYPNCKRKSHLVQLKQSKLLYPRHYATSYQCKLSWKNSGKSAHWTLETQSRIRQFLRKQGMRRACQDAKNAPSYSSYHNYIPSFSQTRSQTIDQGRVDRYKESVSGYFYKTTSWRIIQGLTKEITWLVI